MDYGEILERLLERSNISKEEAKSVCIAMGKNEIEAEVAAAILAALRCKGEDAEEIAGFAEGLREMAIKIGPYPEAIDTAGTGGDRAGLMNVSTASAIVLAEVGKVVKHGNRSVSSVSGSADVLETIGYNIQLGPQEAERALKASNFVFLFAPLYHPAMKNIMPIRKKMRVRTIFNLIGPLSNPARPGYQLLGVATKELMEKMAKAMTSLGIKRAFVVHGEPGIDEVSPIGSTYIIEVEGNELREGVFKVPEPYKVNDLGLLKVRDKVDAAVKFIRSLSGEFEPGSKFVALNAGLGISLLEGVDLEDGVREAYEIIKSGAAYERLVKAVEASGGRLKTIRELVHNRD